MKILLVANETDAHDHCMMLVPDQYDIYTVIGTAIIAGIDNPIVITEMTVPQECTLKMFGYVLMYDTYKVSR